MPRIRIHHTKNQLLRYTGTLDMQKLWERTLRRALLPVEYSQGFHPQPRIQLACPLPLGMTSKSEYVDFWLEKPYEIGDLSEKINTVKHDGMDILDIQMIDEKQPSLQSRLTSVIYRITLAGENLPEKLETRLSSMLEIESIILERRGKKYDLRPLIESCTLSKNPQSSKTEIFMTLAARPRATGRPEEVLKVLGIEPDTVQIEREEIIFEPLPSSPAGS